MVCEKWQITLKDRLNLGALGKNADALNARSNNNTAKNPLILICSCTESPMDPVLILDYFGSEYTPLHPG